MKSRSLIWLPTAPSTNDIAWTEGRKRGIDGLCVVADAQTAGRGRHGRSWVSPTGKDLLFSVYLRPPAPIAPAGIVTAIGAVAVCETIETFAGATHASPLPAAIRWPNDLYVGERKLCGILAEERADCAVPDYVLGIGLNVNSLPEDWPPEIQPFATSLRVETGRESDRQGLLGAILDRIGTHYSAVKCEDLAPLEKSWSDRSALRGRGVRILSGGKEFAGVVEEAGLGSGIALRLPNGSLRRFQAEHVERVGPLT